MYRNEYFCKEILVEKASLIIHTIISDWALLECRFSYTADLSVSQNVSLLEDPYYPTYGAYLDDSSKLRTPAWAWEYPASVLL